MKHLLKVPLNKFTFKWIDMQKKETSVKCDWVVNALSYKVRQSESVAGEHIALTSAYHTL